MTHPGQHWPPDHPGNRMQLWMWPGPGPVEWVGSRAAPTTPVRIGDVERDRAISVLSDHFAAGRLTREELDERVDRAMQARFDADLRPLFADLPRPEPTATVRPGAPAYPSPLAVAFATLFWLLPLLLVIGVLTAVLAGAPWILWGVLWVVILMKVFGRRHRSYHSQRPRY
jgi:hypothetical protein